MGKEKKKIIAMMKKQSEEIRELLIEVVSKNGGHLASNLGVVELTLGIHKVFNPPKDKIIFDVGHQSYVHKILTDRKERFETIRKKEGLGPFTDPMESEYDAFIGGHAGTALSAGCGIAKANPDSKVIIVIGDASICNGHSFEALNNMNEDAKNIIVILNDNEMSIDKNVGSFSNFLNKIISSTAYKGLRREIRSIVNHGKIGGRITRTIERAEKSVKQFLAPLSISEMLGFKFFGMIDGHNIEEIMNCLEKAKKEEGPCFIHVKTKKGKGYSFAENNCEKFHGISPFDSITGIVNEKKKTYSNIVENKIVEMGEMDSTIHCISAGMTKSVGFGEFFEKFPDRSKDVGISEGHAVTYCAGLAISGENPYIGIYSTFIQRGFSQLIHDIGLQKLSVKFLIDRAGIVGEDGKTHNGLYDIAMFLTVPNMMLFAPTTGVELKEILEETKNIKEKSVMIRYPREAVFEYEFADKFQIGKWREVITGKEVLIITAGTMFQEILNIKKELKEIGIEPTIVSSASLKPFDEKYIEENFEKYNNIFILEEGLLENGFISQIINYCNKKNIFKKINGIGIEESLIAHGSRDEIMRKYGLRGEKLVEKIKGVINAQK